MFQRADFWRFCLHVYPKPACFGEKTKQNSDFSKRPSLARCFLFGPECASAAVCAARGQEQLPCLLALFVLALGEPQRLPNGTGSHESCSRCEGPAIVAPTHFLSLLPAPCASPAPSARSSFCGDERCRTSRLVRTLATGSA